MSKIDIDKFVASVYKRLLSQMGFVRMPDTDYSREFLKALDEALKDNGLKFWCDEIVEIEPKLSNLEQNGKNSKTANFAKSSKDLQEPKQDEDTKVYYPTPFDQKLYALASSCCILSDDSRKIFILEHSKDLLDIAHKQFKQDQMNQECATFTRQEFNDAVDEEIKRRCEGIDVDEMFDKVPSCLFLTEYDFYKKGVVDTINKLKGE